MSGNRSVFDGPDANSMDLGFGPDPQPQPQDNQEPAAGGVHLTQEQFQQLIASLGQQRQEFDYAAAISGQQPAALPEIDLSQLPDPRTDYDAFKASLAQGLTAARDQILQGAQQQVSQAQQTSDLLNEAWATMQERYPELVGNEDIVGLAKEREVASLAARGVDWTLALRHNMDAAIDAVASRALSTIHRVRGFDDGDGDGSYDRTDMISGGSPRREGRRERAETPTSLVDDLKKIQREMGIY